MTLIGSVLPATANMKGFDCNQRVSKGDAEKFYSAGYRFAVRYVRRSTAHDFDLSTDEANDILSAGLGLMVVQHVAPDGWMPTGESGQQYGATASQEAKAVGVPNGVSLWLDLEGVVSSAPVQWVIDYCNRWHAEVSNAGFEPGIYVGWSCRLNSVQLHDNLRFKHYWGAYNCDVIPAVRGFQMKQSAMLPPDKVQGISYEFDVNRIKPDLLGGLPQILMPVCQ